jgi:hypothetical protein
VSANCNSYVGFAQSLLNRFLEFGPIHIAVKMIEQQHAHGIYQWTFHNSVIAAWIGWADSRNDRTKSVRFGNK